MSDPINEAARELVLKLESVLETWAANDSMGLIVVRKGTLFEHGQEDIAVAMRKIVGELEADNKCLLKALNSYGVHAHGCQVYSRIVDPECSCGFSEALAIGEETKS